MSVDKSNMTSIEDQKVQNFLARNIKFLEDLQKVKLSATLKKDRELLLRLSNDFAIKPEEEEVEETYDGDDGGLYGDFGEDDDEIDIGGSIQGEGARILNLHASYKGWLRDEGWFRSTRWYNNLIFIYFLFYSFFFFGGVWSGTRRSSSIRTPTPTTIPPRKFTLL